ncbi:MAG: hypothetical protein NZ903_00910 [Candidatus Micrarchaeota archaeon]|nr:hypothetical protein [Candidatus Micrarchaeota archaeon]
MRGIHNFSIIAGRTVAAMILEGEKNLEELDKEIEHLMEIRNNVIGNLQKDNKEIDFAYKISKEIKEIKGIEKLRKVLLIASRFKNIDFSSNKGMTKEEIKVFVGDNNNVLSMITSNPKFNKGNKISFLSLCKITKSTDLFFQFLLFGLLKINLKEDKKVNCYFCNTLDYPSLDYSLIKLSNVTNYVSHLHNSSLCLKCSIYSYLSNLYPISNEFRNNLKNKEIKYLLLSDTDIDRFNYNITDFTPSYLFMENLFERFIKHIAIEPNQRLYLVFYEEGDRSSNNSIHSISEFNILPTLVKMLEKDQYSDTNFNNMFNSVLLEDGLYLTSLSQFIQNDYMNIGLIKSYLKVFRTRLDEIRYTINYFFRFLKTYEEVKNMDEQSNKALCSGRMLGEKIVKGDQDNAENIRKRLVSISATMEMSEKEFIKNLVQLIREYRVEFNIRDIDDIAR